MSWRKRRGEERQKGISCVRYLPSLAIKGIVTTGPLEYVIWEVGQNQGFSTLELLTLRAWQFLVVGASGALYDAEQHPWPLSAGCQQPPSPSVTPICLQTLPNVPGGGEGKTSPNWGLQGDRHYILRTIGRKLWPTSHSHGQDVRIIKTWQRCTPRHTMAGSLKSKLSKCLLTWIKIYDWTHFMFWNKNNQVKS